MRRALASRAFGKPAPSSLSARYERSKDGAPVQLLERRAVVEPVVDRHHLGIAPLGVGRFEHDRPARVEVAATGREADTLGRVSEGAVVDERSEEHTSELQSLR